MLLFLALIVPSCIMPLCLMAHFMRRLSLAMSRCVVRQNEKGPTLWGPSRIQKSLRQFCQFYFELQAIGVALIGEVVNDLGE